MRTVFGLIPLAALGLLVFEFRRRRESWREAILAAGLAWGVAATVITEALSAASLLTFDWVLAAWLALCVALLVRRGPAPAPAGTLLELGAARPWWPALAALALMVLVIGFIAVIAPPNTADSLIYHMPRIAHWIQNGNVAFYPTHTLRQLHLAPWAEFAILQLQILSSSDRWANLIQWLAMLGSLVGVSAIARRLGGDLRGQLLAVIFCATLPMGIVQAAGTQNDYVLSFWLVCFVYYALELMRPEAGEGQARTVWSMGVALGLAIFTKAIAYTIALPFLAWLAVDGLVRRRERRWRALAIVVLAIVLINAGHYWRNSRLFGSPLGPGREGDWTYANEVFSVPALVSNVARNITLHIGTPSERFNVLIELAVLRVHRYLGADANDPRTTWRGEEYHVIGPTTNEDLAPNPLHLVLIGVAGVMLVLVRALRRDRGLVIYVGAVVAAFLLFVLYLKWQPWHSRLHLPMFVLWAPAIGVIWSRYRRTTGVVIAVLLLMSLPWVVDSTSRPLIGEDSVLVKSRAHQYFNRRKDLLHSYTAVVRRLKDTGCSDLGLWLHDLPEYPVWILVGQQAGKGQGWIEDVHVGNDSKTIGPLAGRPGDPCAILLRIVGAPPPPFIPLKSSIYYLTFQDGPVNVFMKERARP